jgi:hypothetical protein
VKKKTEVLIPFLEPQSWMSPLVRSLIPNMWFHVASLQVFRLTMWQQHIILENHVQTLELDWLLQTWRLHSKDPVGLTSYWRGLGRYCTSLLCPWINIAESYITIGFDKMNFSLLVLSWEANFNTTGGDRFKRQKLFSGLNILALRYAVVTRGSSSTFIQTTRATYQKQGLTSGVNPAEWKWLQRCGEGRQGPLQVSWGVDNPLDSSYLVDLYFDSLHFLVWCTIWGWEITKKLPSPSLIAMIAY